MLGGLLHTSALGVTHSFGIGAETEQSSLFALRLANVLGGLEAGWHTPVHAERLLPLPITRCQEGIGLSLGAVVTAD